MKKAMSVMITVLFFIALMMCYVEFTCLVTVTGNVVISGFLSIYTIMVLAVIVEKIRL